MLSPVLIPEPSIKTSGISRIAGSQLNLTCEFSESPSVNTPIYKAVSWIFNCSEVAILPDRISTEGNTLAFSPLDISDAGRYICVLAITSLKEHVTEPQPKKSKEKLIKVQGTTQ